MSVEPVLARFSYESYLDVLLRFRDAGYQFAAFADAPRLLDEGRRFALLRHDVDLDLEKAVQLARREADAAAAATYFFLVRTDHYNIFSARGTECVREILARGHRLGLHFDCAAYPGAEVAAIRAACAREAAMLEHWFQTPVTVVSFHRPSPSVLSGDAELSAPLPHTYMPLFCKTIRYLSDSTGRWRYEYPPQSGALCEGLPVQLLTHPIWYAETPRPPYAALCESLSAKAAMLERSFAANCIVMRQGGRRPHDAARPGQASPPAPPAKDAA